MFPLHLLGASFLFLLILQCQCGSVLLLAVLFDWQLSAALLTATVNSPETCLPTLPSYYIIVYNKKSAESKAGRQFYILHTDIWAAGRRYSSQIHAFAFTWTDVLWLVGWQCNVSWRFFSQLTLLCYFNSYISLWVTLMAQKPFNMTFKCLQTLQRKYHFFYYKDRRWSWIVGGWKAVSC